MSWFTDLAGKAESLLNNIDQSAAGAIKANEALSSLSGSPTPTKPPPPEKTKEAPISSRHSIAQIYSSRHSFPPTTVSDLKPSSKLSYTKTEAAKKPERQRASAPKKDKDDALFDFLNSNAKSSSPRSGKARLARGGIQKSTSSTSVASSISASEPQKPSDTRHETPKPAQKEEPPTLHAPPLGAFHISRSSSIDSMNSKGTSNKPARDNGSSSSDANEQMSEIDVVSYPMDTASESEFELVSKASASSGGASERDSGEDAADAADKNLLTNLKMENRMLQDEIKALHREMKSLSERNIRSKADTEKMISDVRRRNDDLMEEFNVKSSQMEAMNIEINDLERENKTLKQTIRNLQTERERIIEDQTAGSGMHAQAMDQLRSRLEEAEASVIRERDFTRTVKEDSLREREKQETESRKLVENLRKSEAERQAQKKRMEDLSKEVNSLQSNLAANKHELSDYKQKASRILQSKERLITSLKGGSEADLTASTTASIELEELKQERDSLKENLMTARAELIQVKNDFQEMEGQYQQENSVLQEEMDEVKRNFEEETRSRREAESDVNRFEQEIRKEKEEATRSRAAANERLRDKEEEVERLRSQLMMRSRNVPEESELESRLRQLTETLIQKQTIVETLATEKSSLILQLERAEGQIKRLSQENSAHVQVLMNGNEENGAGVHNRSNTHSTMFDFNSGPEHGVVGKVRKAASAVDRFSVRLGVFLRRYPTARLFVIVYMGLLHLWVMIVLLTYSPEIHGADFHQAQPHSPLEGHNAIEHQAAHGLPNDG